MDNVLQNKELRLSALGEFLLKQRLVKEEHARYHVLWVRKFLAQRIASTRGAGTGSLLDPSGVAPCGSVVGCPAGSDTTVSGI